MTTAGLSVSRRGGGTDESNRHQPIGEAEGFAREGDAWLWSGCVFVHPATHFTRLLPPIVQCHCVREGDTSPVRHRLFFVTPGGNCFVNWVAGMHDTVRNGPPCLTAPADIGERSERHRCRMTACAPSSPCLMGRVRSLLSGGCAPWPCSHGDTLICPGWDKRACRWTERTVGMPISSRVSPPFSHPVDE